ncbi:MAG: SusC/RagA family TonB-linked outer membrane protein [Candidatus Marinimicrobia bacterium]|nr:SusC/RagA family TonB-linked outer membrane protein [Candidatus Neomarinimicrobiota bacterium]
MLINRILGRSLIILLVAGMGFAHSQTLSGKITDSETGEPLPGAQVFVKGTFVGTTTDVNGAYSLDVDGSVTVVIAYIGYKTQEVATSGGSGDFAMEPDVLRQDEVVVTGLVSTVKRRNAANAVASVSGDDLVNAPTQTLDQALSGQFAGVNIRRNSGAPGGGVNVNLRGQSTLTGSTQPLYVIDGVIVNNDANQSGIDVVTAATGAGSSRPQGQPTNRIGDINPNDIESIEVLKGASAAAIYGAKASNGVIIIKTKRGRGGKTKFNFSTKTGQSSLLRKMGHRVFETYAEAEEQYGADVASLGNNSSGSWAGNDFDYEEILYGETGQLTEHTLSAVGGDESTQFYLGGQYMDEGGIIKNTGYKKLSGRMNVDHRLSEKAKVSVSTNLIRSEADRGVTGNDNTNMTYGFSIGFTPSFIDIRDTDGDGVYPINPTNPSNPLETAEYFVNNEVTHRALGSMTFDYNLYRASNMDLGFLAVAGADFYNQENEVFIPPFLQIESSKDEAGQSVMTTTDNLNTNLSLNLVHKMKMSGMNFNTTAGLQYETYDWNSVFVHAIGMIPTQTNVDKASSQSVYHDRKKRQDRGQFFQEEITVGDNLYVAFSMRGDVSSTMGDTETKEWYPKAAASYQLGEFAVFDNLKLRGAFGQTGNMPQSKAKYTTMSSSNIGGINGLVASSTRGNASIKPERTTEMEFGMDFSLMNGLASVEATMYQQDIEDLILLVDLPPSSGASYAWENGGEMTTNGMEFALGLNPTALVSVGGLDWNFHMTYYTNESEVTKLTVDPYNFGGFATFLGTYRIEEGYSPSAIVGSEMTDGKHDVLGDENPDYRLSFRNSFSFGPVSLSFLIDRKEGGSAINLANLIYDLGGTTADFEENGGDRLANLGAVTAPYIESTSYTALRDLSMTYTLPSSMTEGFGVSYLQVGLSARNWWMTSEYTGLSPEVSQFGNEAVGGSVDTNPFPLSKSMYVTLSMGF